MLVAHAKTSESKLLRHDISKLIDLFAHCSKSSNFMLTLQRIRRDPEEAGPMEENIAVMQRYAHIPYNLERNGGDIHEKKTERTDEKLQQQLELLCQDEQRRADPAEPNADHVPVSSL